MPGDENLASAYVTILPDMSKFVEELASKLQAAVDSQHPKVTVEADLDASELETKAQAAADALDTTLGNKHVTPTAGLDIAPLIAELAVAKSALEDFASQIYSPTVIPKILPGVGGGGATTDSGVSEAAPIAGAEGGVLSSAAAAALASDALSHLNPNVANSPGFRQFLSRVVDDLALNAHEGEKGGDAEGGVAPPVVIPLEVDLGPVLAEIQEGISEAEAMADEWAGKDFNAAIGANNANALASFAAAEAAGHEWAGEEFWASANMTFLDTQDMLNELDKMAEKISAAEAMGDAWSSEDFVASLGFDDSEAIAQMAEDNAAAAKWATSDWTANADITATDVVEAFQDLEDLGKMWDGGDFVAQFGASAADVAEAYEAADALGQKWQENDWTAIFEANDASVLADTAKLSGDLEVLTSKKYTINIDADTSSADAKFSALLTALSQAKTAAAAKILTAADQQGMGLSPAQMLQIAHTPTTSGVSGIAAMLGLSDALASGGGGGASAGFLATLLPGLFGGGTGKGGKGTLASSLGWGGGSNIPWLGALAGMGSVGSLMGFGPEHVIMTGVGLAGSAVGAGIGAGLLGAGMLGTTAVGFGTDLAGTGQAVGDTKAVYTAQQALGTAQTQYGANSGQALTAQLALNTALQDFSPVARNAVSAVATMADTLHQEFNSVTGEAEKMGAQILLSFGKVAEQYIPTIGKFATQNTSIIQKALVPLESWLGSEKGGLGIFTSIEQTFQDRLPAAMGALVQGLEVVIRTFGYLSQYGGSAMQKLDDFFTKLNTATSGTVTFSRWEKFMSDMIHDFEVWKGFVEILGKDLFDLFRLDAGLGDGIISTLTQMLDKLHAYLVSTGGQQAIHDVFEVHKQQVIDLLGLIPPLVRAFEPIIHIMPAMTMLTLPFISALVQLLDLLEDIPFGIGDTVAGLLGFGLLLGHLIGYGKSFAFLRDTITSIVPALGRVAAAMLPFDFGLTEGSIAATALNIALGIGVVGALVAVGYGLDYVFRHFGTFVGVLTTAAVAVGAFALAWNVIGIENIVNGITTAVIKMYEAITTARTATVGSAETEAAATTQAATEAAAGVSAAGAKIIESNEAQALSYGELAAAAQAAAEKEIASAGAAAGGVGAEDLAGAGAAGALPDLRAAAPDLLEADAPEAAGGLAALGTTLAGVASAAAPVVAIAAPLAAGLTLWKVSSDAASSSMHQFLGNLTDTATTATTTLPQLTSKLSDLNAKLHDIESGHGAQAGGIGGFLGAAGNADFSSIIAIGQAVTTTKAQIKALDDNTQWLGQHFHITAQQAQQLAQSLGINLTGTLGGADSANVTKFGAALQQMGLHTNGVATAMSTLAKQSGTTLAAVTQATSQAASAMQQTMSTYSSVVTGLTAAPVTQTAVASDTVTKFYQTQVQNAAAFASGIQDALKEGFSPEIINQILTAGPAQGLTSLQALLQGAAGSSGKAFVQMTNQGQTYLDLESARMVEMSSLMAALGTYSQTQQKKIQGNLGSAMSIWDENMTNGLKGVSASFVNAFKGGASGLTKVANEFGLTLPNVLVSGGKTVSLATYQQVQAYLHALANAKAPADVASKGVASSLPDSFLLEQGATKNAVNTLLSTANTTLTTGKAGTDKAAQGPASSLPTAVNSTVGAVGAAGTTSVNSLGSSLLNGKTLLQPHAAAAAAVFPTAVTTAQGAVRQAGLGTTSALNAALLSGKPILGSTGKASGKAVTDGVASNDSKPAGVALVNGMIAGINSSQGALNSAALAVMKNAIAAARPDVGGQSLGVALDQGIAQGISSSASIVSTAASAAVTAAKTAASQTAGHTSPAKLFIPLGEAISEGIALGITNNAHLAATAASNVVKSAAASARTASGSNNSLLGMNTSVASPPAASAPVVYFNPQYTISGGADPSTVAQWKTLTDQRDNTLLQKMRAR